MAGCECSFRNSRLVLLIKSCVQLKTPVKQNSLVLTVLLRFCCLTSVSAFKESKTLLEYKPCILYHFPLWMVFRCSSSEQPLPPPRVHLYHLLCLLPVLVGTQDQAWSGLTQRELTFQPFHRLRFTFHFRKEESSNLGGTVGLNAPDQGIWIGLECDGLGVNVTESLNWLECEWRGDSVGEVIYFEDGPLLEQKAEMMVALPPGTETHRQAVSLFSSCISNILGKPVSPCVTLHNEYDCVTRGRMQGKNVYPRSTHTGATKWWWDTQKKGKWSWLFSF